GAMCVDVCWRSDEFLQQGWRRQNGGRDVRRKTGEPPALPARAELGSPLGNLQATTAGTRAASIQARTSWVRITCAPLRMSTVSVASVPYRRSPTGASCPLRASIRPTNDFRDAPASSG